MSETQPRPMRDPDIPGRAPAWRIDMSGLEPSPDDAPVGDSYLLCSPASHPFWHWHFVSMVHLRDLPGQTRAPVRRFPGATHEILCFALDPNKPLPDPDDWASRVDGLFLQPPDWIVQFEVPSDEHALRVYRTVIRAATATASVDSDLARFWHDLVEKAAAHERGGIPEHEIVAVRHINVGGHRHIVAVKLADGSVQDAQAVVHAIEEHDAHYVMRPPEGAPAYEAHQRTGLPLLVQTRQCPDCTETVIWA